jgi:hypothetical protein
MNGIRRGNTSSSLDLNEERNLMQTQKCSKCDRGWDLNEAAMSVESCGADLHDKGQTFPERPFGVCSTITKPQ